MARTLSLTIFFAFTVTMWAHQDCGKACNDHSDCSAGCNFCSGPGGKCEEGFTVAPNGLTNCSANTFEAMCEASDTPGDCRWCADKSACVANGTACPTNLAAKNQPAQSLALSPAQPEQVHLALGAHGSMTVTFVTVGSSEKSPTSQVQYRELSGGATNTVQADVSTYTAGGWKGLIHKATLTGLTRGSSYTYRCGAGAVWSDWFDTKYLTSDPGKVTLAIVADLDGREADGISTIDALNREAAKGTVDALLHAGDIAYIKGETNEATYDQYFRQLQPTASKVPYHVAVGNQEHWNNFSGYNSRFSMPGNTSMANYWHSIDVGPVHALFLSTEHPYDADSEQYSYALNDLKSVDKEITPWVLVLLHRPLYCSTNDYYDCQMAGPKKLRPALEPLFAAQGVDAVVAGHVHNYERTAGVLNGKISEKAPVHITVGNAGDIEGMTRGWQHPKPDWSLVQSLELAWSRWTVTKTSMLVELVASGNGTILDSVTYTK